MGFNFYDYIHRVILDLEKAVLFLSLAALCGAFPSY
jgi:hypothetical protein